MSRRMHDIEHALCALLPLLIGILEIAARKVLNARIAFTSEPGHSDHAGGLNHADLSAAELYGISES